MKTWIRFSLTGLMVWICAIWHTPWVRPWRVTPTTTPNKRCKIFRKVNLTKTIAGVNESGIWAWKYTRPNSWTNFWFLLWSHEFMRCFVSSREINWNLKWISVNFSKFTDAFGLEKNRIWKAWSFLSSTQFLVTRYLMLLHHIKHGGAYLIGQRAKYLLPERIRFFAKKL